MRPNVPLLPFALAAAALAATVLLELRDQPREGGAVTPFPAARLLPASPGRPASSDPGQARWAATSLARPLFSPSRRLPAASPATLGVAAPSLPRMAGVVITASERQAIFATRNGTKPLVVGEGGQVGAFTVQSIHAGQVTVLGPEGERVLRPAFDPDPPAPRPALSQPALEAPIPSALAIPGLPTPRS